MIPSMSYLAREFSVSGSQKWRSVWTTLVGTGEDCGSVVESAMLLDAGAPQCPLTGSRPSIVPHHRRRRQFFL